MSYEIHSISSQFYFFPNSVSSVFIFLEFFFTIYAVFHMGFRPRGVFTHIRDFWWALCRQNLQNSIRLLGNCSALYFRVSDKFPSFMLAFQAPLRQAWVVWGSRRVYEVTYRSFYAFWSAFLQKQNFSQTLVSSVMYHLLWLQKSNGPSGWSALVDISRKFKQ